VRQRILIFSIWGTVASQHWQISNNYRFMLAVPAFMATNTKYHIKQYRI
jgi:hypothetical protein